MTRLLLSLLVLVFLLILVALMYLGFRNRRRRQAAALPAFPHVPVSYTDPDAITTVLPRADGVYISTTTTASWQDRVVVGDYGFRANASLYRAADGVLIERAGSANMWIPQESIVDVRREKGLAGKVMGTDSLLVIRWRNGDVEFDTGFLGDHQEDYPKWIDSLTSDTTENAGDNE
jgi:hypothetical protein